MVRLTRIKDCAKCKHSLVYKTLEDKEVKCNCDEEASRRLYDKNGRYGASKCYNYCEQDETKISGVVNQDIALEFMLSGQAEFILHSTKTNEDFRFKLEAQQSKIDSTRNIYFVHQQQIYCGVIGYYEERRVYWYKQGEKGQLAPNDRSIRSLIHVLTKLQNKEEVSNLEVYHVGKCGRCGRTLDKYNSTGKCNRCIEEETP